GWEGGGGEEVCRRLDADGLPESPFGPEGNRLVTWKDQFRTTPCRISVWDLSGGKGLDAREHAGWNVRGIPGFPGFADGRIAFGGNGTRVAGIVLETPLGAQENTLPFEARLKVWDESGNLLLSLPQTGSGLRGYSYYFSPDGSRLAVYKNPLVSGVSSPGELTVWDVKTGDRVLFPGLGHRFDNQGAPTLSPDGKQIVMTDGNVVLLS